MQRVLHDPLEYGDAHDNLSGDSGQIFAAQVAAKAAERISQQIQAQQAASLSNYVPATPPEFVRRIDKALEKNFAYLRRKDEETAQRILNGGNASHPLNYYTNIGPPRISKHNFTTTTNISRAGIGAPAVPAVQEKKPQQECTRVYVHGLPKDITEEEMAILFSPQGKIRKIKLYTAADGSKKGDALITFMKAESAVSACLKLNKLDIGDQHIIGVSMAEFTAAVAEESASVFIERADVEGTNNGLGSISSGSSSGCSNDIYMSSGISCTGNSSGSDSNSGISSSSDGEKYYTSLDRVILNLRAMLPAEMDAGDLPVVMILNSYSQSAHADPIQLSELQADMLEACCSYGDVKAMKLLLLHEAVVREASLAVTTAATAVGTGILDSESPLLPPAAVRAGDFVCGAIAVAFERREGAIGCCRGLNERWFDNRQLWALLLPPHHVPASSNTHRDDVGAPLSQQNQVGSEQLEFDSLKHDACEKAANDVEDFLNSLL